MPAFHGQGQASKASFDCRYRNSDLDDNQGTPWLRSTSDRVNACVPTCVSEPLMAKGNESSLAAPAADVDERPPARIGLLALFLLFSRLGLSSFGGNTSAWIHREFVEQRQLVGQSEFIAALGLCRIMPGATVVNLAVVIGRQLRGGAGACAAVLGHLLSPSLAGVA